MPSVPNGRSSGADDVSPEEVAAPERCAIYMRSAHDGPGAVVDAWTQAAILERYIHEHGLWNTRGYVDTDVDDLTFLEQRRQGALLLADAKAGEFDMVVFATPSSLSRSMDVIADAIARLTVAGVALRVVADDPHESALEPEGEGVA